MFMNSFLLPMHSLKQTGFQLESSLNYFRDRFNFISFISKSKRHYLAIVFSFLFRIVAVSVVAKPPLPVHFTQVGIVLLTLDTV